jgi:hypothetical protein
MPNGDPNFAEQELPALEEFFRPLQTLLTDFAQQHTLKLTKYYHQAPAWMFAFRHPKGGVGQIEVSRADSHRLGITGCWWYDDYVSLQRNLKRHSGRSLTLESPDIADELEACLYRILSWEFGTWDGCHSGYTWGKTWTKEQFEALLDDYPIPK